MCSSSDVDIVLDISFSLEKGCVNDTTKGKETECKETETTADSTIITKEIKTSTVYEVSVADRDTLEKSPSGKSV